MIPAKILSPSFQVILVPDSELSELIKEGYELSQSNPEILNRLEKDLDEYGKGKKQMRLEDKLYVDMQQASFAGILQEVEITAEQITNLEEGRPRMCAFLVFVFLLIRGYFGGIKSKQLKTLLTESSSLLILYQELGLAKAPGLSTISENINAISNETRNYIIDVQLQKVLKENLEDFKAITVDSTATSANSKFPTDSNLLVDLVARIIILGSKLNIYGIPNLDLEYPKTILKKMKSLEIEIAFSLGKKGGKRKRKKAYKKLLQYANKLHYYFTNELDQLAGLIEKVNLIPSKKLQLIRLIELLQQRVEQLEQVSTYCEQRVFEDKKVPIEDKTISLSDEDAGFIVKGQREPVIGYKPQLGRSKQGFISAFILPQGNAADSGQFVPLVDDHINRTTVIPVSVSSDDGYASKIARQEILEKGVKFVSISGSKGKRIIPEEEYESGEYHSLRNDRSAVESLMFVIKHNCHFAQVMRRGLEQVKAELLEQILAYNILRAVFIRNRISMAQKNIIS